MNRLAVAFPLLVLLSALAAAQDKNADSFDQLDLNDLLSDKDHVQAAIQCLLEEADTACIPAIKSLKSELPEVLKDNCAKCTDAHRKKIDMFSAFVSEHYPEQTRQFLDKYDPTKEYRSKFGKEWAERGIKL